MRTSASRPRSHNRRSLAGDQGEIWCVRHARRQHGVVSVRQLLALGHARATIGVWAQSGKLHRLHRGVYAVGHQALTWERRCVAALLANEPAVASHLTAAWIWGLGRTRPGTFHVTAPTRRHGKDFVVVHFATLDEADRAVRHRDPGDLAGPDGARPRGGRNAP